MLKAGDGAEDEVTTRYPSIFSREEEKEARLPAQDLPEEECRGSSHLLMPVVVSSLGRSRTKLL